MKIYTIVVTYNAMPWIDKCLQCLHESTITTIPILVDNLSTDETRSYIPTNYSDVIWLPQEKNIGFGQGNNIGIRYALEHGADYVLLLNQDAYIDSRALELMLSESDGQSLMSPVHLNGEGTKLDAMFRYLIKEAGTTIEEDVLIHAQLQKSYQIGRVSAACWFIPIIIIKEVGGFNKLFFHYSEDDNFLNRLTFFRIKTILVPEAKVRHDRGEHGNMEVFSAKQLHRDILLIACNINFSSTLRIRKYLRRLYECYFWDMPQHSYIPLVWTREILWLICHHHEIKESRALEIKKGPSWL